MKDILYYITIYPIELVVEIVFSVINEHFGNPGLAIIGVSIVISLLSFPLYRRADIIQNEERRKQESMSRWISHIRKHFKGDEKIMILSAYYREQHYQPLYVFKSSISLLLQIPFFIAAYHFLSSLSLLNGTGFLFIRDLGKPDRLLHMGSATINVLPVIMTLINFCSTAVYTHNYSWKNKWQPYAIAVFFLVFLYNSPSGLVFYWTMNNLFSFGKNILMKRMESSGKKRISSARVPHPPVLSPRQSTSLFFLGSSLLVLLLGLYLPSSVISAAPADFIDPDHYRNPLVYLFVTFLISAGFFWFWCTVFFYFTPKHLRDRFSILFWLLSGMALTNCFVFGKNPGNMSSLLIFDVKPVYQPSLLLINLALLLILILLLFILIRRRPSFTAKIYYAVLFCLFVMSFLNIRKTVTVLSGISYMSESREDSYAEDQLTIPLTDTGKNVVIIMLDRAISGYIPFIFAEKPELQDKFAGFSYYPNTISFGAYTNFASAALFGGYEYTTDSINKRDTMSLAEKQNEALLLMPVLFSSHGFKTTVYNPPLANYQSIPDLSIYNDYPDISAHYVRGKASDLGLGKYQFEEKARKHAFFMYSVYKISPLFLRRFVYNGGNYLTAEAAAFNEKFLNAYSVLKKFIFSTNISNEPVNSFFVIDNETSHEPCELQLPDYEPSDSVNNGSLEKGYRFDQNGNRLLMDEQYHYHANMAALLQLGLWFDYLRDAGVYDNTRIIIVADHGRGLNQFPYLIQNDGSDMEWVNPLLLFKDFDSGDPLKTSDDFMTNADTPSLAMQGLIEDPVNPFTGNRISTEDKHLHDQLVTLSQHFDILKNNGNTFDTSDAPWYSVHDNIFDQRNWKEVSP